MNIFERYMLVQQIKPFIFFSFVLVGILWLIQALPRLDDVISNGQSGIVFLDIALLILPQVMLLVLPIAAFASTLYAIHKLITESELIIFMNAGLSNIKLIRPVIFFGGMNFSTLSLKKITPILSLFWIAEKAMTADSSVTNSCFI